jgi:hypothetical protein
VEHFTSPACDSPGDMRGFYIVSSWFLATTAASGREGGLMPDPPGRSNKGVHHDGLPDSGSGNGPAIGTGGSALDILDLRLANGQMDLPSWEAQRAALLGVQDVKK